MKYFARLRRRSHLDIQLIGDAHRALDQHLVCRKHTLSIVIVVLKSYAHMAAEEQRLRYPWELRRTNGRQAPDGLSRQQLNHCRQRVMASAAAMRPQRVLLAAQLFLALKHIIIDT
jgi:hypothetical protein